jgi:2-polyprenyl-3-methyl-5-hydroxy-6-metoxy-1,4-benzoquinol methylase
MQMSEEEIRNGLLKLDPSIPWAHHFDLGFGIETISPLNEQFYRKSVGLNKFAELIVSLIPQHTRRGTVQGLHVLDLACGEGGHSIAMARAGAMVSGIDGRQLYVDRAKFAARACGVTNVEFDWNDVRKVEPAHYEKFELVLFSGILHHLAQNDFEGMLNILVRLTKDTLIIYTHVSTPASIKTFNLQGPVKTKGGHEGYLFREHKDTATEEQRLKKVRASLDNTYSFWATEESLVKALIAAGFKTVAKLLAPHIFGWQEAAFRPILIARV